MEALQLSFDPAWAFGLLLATARVGAFVIAAPQLGRAVPRFAKLAFTFSIGWFLTSPVSGTITVGRMIGLAVANSLVGVLLGWLLGVLFQMFSMAGAIIDMSAGTTAGMILDPTRGEQGAVFSRLFNMVGLTLFHAFGGLGLLATGLALSVRAVPLHATPTLGPGLTGAAAGLVGKLMVAATEVALPVFAVLLMAEIVFGLAARFAPTANVFLLGLPAKTLLAILMAGLSVALFPEAMTGLMDVSRKTMVEILNGIAPL